MKKTLFPACGFLLGTGAAAGQVTIHVPQDQPTIQRAIAVAADGDTVAVAPGTYVEQIDFLGKAITVASTDGAAVTTIDSQGGEAWSEFPAAAVVRMVSGEGPGTVLQGFTITGGGLGSFGPPDGPGVWCYGLNPTILDCVITENRYGGVRGDALLVGCTIRRNTSLPYEPGGGVWGRATIVDCIIERNKSGDDGGGVHATGPCLIVNSVIDGNIAGNGYDGYSGGGVYGPATLIGCQITNNVGNHYQAGGPTDALGTGVEGAVALTNCTVAFNRIGSAQLFGHDLSGGVRGLDTIVENCILWGNEGYDVAWFPPITVGYSIVGSGYAGTGVLTADPLFVDAAGGDFHLSLGSPAIDAGNPASPLDPDGTPADLGAYPFAQTAAAVAVRNGTGVNPVSYTSTDVPLLGATWDATVDATLHAFPVALALVAGTLQPSPPIPTAFGELLLDPTGAQVLGLAAAPVAGAANSSVPVPLDVALLGLVVPTQAIAAGAGLELANALDLTLGTF